MLTFNEFGLLTPAQGFTVTLNNLYDEFVRPFPASETRENLFREWAKYNQMLRQEIGVEFTQWVNGSFVTKKLNPKDVDVVSFIPSHLSRNFKKRLDYYWSDSWEREGIDAYLVEIFPDDDYRYPDFRVALTKWYQLYTRTKASGTPPDALKGFLIINIS
ncbi:DUF6932 family protein [Spirosoma soli]|uniref:DUF6932 family protein n=1 Tax=Spirosoma soli TaxID=1770529 RepID=A0ABW5MBN5_9BACT